MKLLAYLKRKEVRRAYRRVSEAQEPVPRTPTCIGPNQEDEGTKNTQRPRAEEEEVRLEKEREKKRKRVDARKKRVEKERMREEEEEREERAKQEELARLKEEEERAERARREEIARVKEERRIRAEKAHRDLGLFSSSEEEDDQEHHDDVAGSYEENEGDDALDQDKVADFPLDFNSKAKEAAEIRRSLAAFNYHTNMEILKVSD
ncbi:vicilin-like seed storage protein At2g18540 [Cynara cardunculus var. scolymus]|uniref:vicilin-like seed storage protein At2g18540 n=1 Tax=Cynara cardunculus var. scolymus TaxID=59895 RepID=UPI000D62BCA3|nr:vicilin-like seed storage protein At2g18540 [Cynara cardunculus var. scolymus]